MTCRCCTAALPTTWRRPTSYRRCYSDLLQRLTTTATAAPLFRASRCVRCRCCFRCPPGTCMSPARLNGDERMMREIGASLRWSVVTTHRCGALSSHCSMTRPRRQRHCCSMHVASRRQSNPRWLRCPPRFCSVNCTPSVQHLMARRRWKRPCVRSRAQSVSSESDSDTLLTITLFFLDISCI